MLLSGINHVAVLTHDTDRLHAFYRDVFDAEVFADQTIRDDGHKGEVLLDRPGGGPADLKPPGTPAAGYPRVTPEA